MATFLPPSDAITILWSTQGGRAKACARRASRILSDYYYYYHYIRSHNSQQNNGSKEEAVGVLPSSFRGTSFDDFGAKEFLNLGCNHGKQGSNVSQKKLLIMFVSTTGDAEHCDSIQATWALLYVFLLAQFCKL
jgi:hypothetical protein